MKKLTMVLAAIALAGCAGEPWTERDWQLVARRCGGVNRVNRMLGTCEGMGTNAAGVWVYEVKPDDSAATSADPVFKRD